MCSKCQIKILLAIIGLNLSINSFGQTEGLFTRNLERTLTDSTYSISINETGRVYRALDGKIVSRKAGNQSILYYYDTGRKVTHLKNGEPYLQKIFIDSLKFQFSRYSHFDTDSVNFSYQEYLREYYYIIGTLDSVTQSRIFKISAAIKREQPSIEIQYFSESRDTVFSSKSNSLIVIDTIDSRTIEMSHFKTKTARIKPNFHLVKRDRYKDGLITYSFSELGDTEMIMDYDDQGLLTNFQIKPLTKGYLVKHYTFIYNERGELIKRKDILTGIQITYQYNYKL